MEHDQFESVHARGRRAIAAIPLALGLGVACGSQESEPDAMTLEAFAHSLAREYCAGVAGCCQAYVGEFDQRACVSMQEEGNMEKLEALSALPGIRFDSHAASQCLEDSHADPACNLHSASKRCEAAFIGELAPGAECENTLQCAREPNETAICDRKCAITKRMVGVGDACDETCGVDCSDESDAESAGETVRACPADEGLQCSRERRCEALRPNGEPCSAWVQCASSYCSSDDTCEDSPEQGAWEGEACSSTVRCTQDLACEDGVCFSAIEAICASLADRLP